MISQSQSDRAIARLKRGRKNGQAPQQGQLVLTAADRYREQFKNIFLANPRQNPHALLPRRYTNPGGKVLAEGESSAQNLDEFIGFGLFLGWWQTEFCKMPE